MIKIVSFEHRFLSKGMMVGGTANIVNSKAQNKIAKAYSQSAIEVVHQTISAANPELKTLLTGDMRTARPMLITNFTDTRKQAKTGDTLFRFGVVYQDDQGKHLALYTQTKGLARDPENLVQVDDTVEPLEQVLKEQYNEEDMAFIKANMFDKNGIYIEAMEKDRIPLLKDKLLLFFSQIEVQNRRAELKSEYGDVKNDTSGGQNINPADKPASDKLIL